MKLEIIEGKVIKRVKAFCEREEARTFVKSLHEKGYHAMLFQNETPYGIAFIVWYWKGGAK